MPTLTQEILTFKKRVPLTISRGTSTHTTVLWLRWSEDGVEGWGEAVPFTIDEHPQTLDVLKAALEAQRGWLERATAWERIEIDRRLRAAGAPSALIAAVNLALYDWLGKRLGQPVWRLLGLPATEGPLTSVTIGIATPEAAVERVRLWRESGDVRALKVKLGSKAGAEADRAMFSAVLGAIPAGMRVSVDANGGWSLATAVAMAAWLAERGVDHLEQPLPRGQEADLAALRATMKIPLIVDESCRTAEELTRLAGSVDGINIKLMKCGGLDGALRLVHTARAHGLKILVGCYGNSALANTAAAQLGGLVDYLDLDSHLNLADDAFRGAELVAGRLRLPAEPGFGVSHHV
jgi:L-alanine-DL-glutamate epimerase-like enolase superfamily enzyme